MDDYTRLPPQALEIERTVLGSMLIDSEAAMAAIERLTETAFYSGSNRIIFSAICEMVEKSIPVDVVTVVEKLKNSDMIDLIGGYSYIAELTESIATSANMEYYCQILIDKMNLRKLITTAGEIVTDCFSSDVVVQSIIESAESKIYAIADTNEKSEVQSSGELIVKTFQEIEQFSKGQTSGYKTGFTELDEKTTGLQKSDLVIIAARPSMGKTAFMLDIAMNMAIKFNYKVAIFSLEMSKSQLMQRMLCSQARVNMHQLRSGTLAKRDFPKLSIAASPIAEAGIYIDDTPGITVSAIRSKARRIKKQFGLDVVFIDYLQLMSGVTSKGGSREQEISSISRGLKGVAKELDVPIAALSQLSRNLENRVGNKRPQLSDLRESGAIEQDADVVLFVYRDEVYNKDEKENIGKAEIIIGKQRNGPLGTANLTFVKCFARFENTEMQQSDEYSCFRGGK